jgi:hypothetical protein
VGRMAAAATSDARVTAVPGHVHSHACAYDWASGKHTLREVEFPGVSFIEAVVRTGSPEQTVNAAICKPPTTAADFPTGWTYQHCSDPSSELSGAYRYTITPHRVLEIDQYPALRHDTLALAQGPHLAVSRPHAARCPGPPAGTTDAAGRWPTLQTLARLRSATVGAYAAPLPAPSGTSLRAGGESTGAWAPVGSL